MVIPLTSLSVSGILLPGLSSPLDWRALHVLVAWLKIPLGLLICTASPGLSGFGSSTSFVSSTVLLALLLLVSRFVFYITLFKMASASRPALVASQIRGLLSL